VDLRRHHGPAQGRRAGAALLALVCCKQPEPAAERAPAPAPERFEPLTPGPGRVVSADGRIAAPIPDGHGWECLEEQHGEAEAAAVALRCRRENPREFLFFAAKTHRQPADQQVDAHTVLMSLYRADHEAFFDRVTYLSDGPAELAGVQGWESELEAEHAQLERPIKKRERLAIAGGRIYAISAEGDLVQWAIHFGAIERWFASVEFAR
jgi:hypothetical protein